MRDLRALLPNRFSPAVYRLLIRAHGDKISGQGPLELRDESAVELVAAGVEFSHAHPVRALDARTLESFYEFRFIRMHEQPWTAEGPWRDYGSEIVALDLVSGIIVPYLAEDSAVAPRVRTICGALGAVDRESGRAALCVGFDAQAATHVLDHWPHTDRPTFDAVRQTLPRIRGMIGHRAAALGLRGAHLAGVRLPAAWRGDRSPVQASIAELVRCTPLVTLRPDYLLLIIQNIIRTVCWSRIGSEHHSGIIAECDRLYHAEIRRFCEQYGPLIGPGARRCEGHMISIFRSCLALAWLSPMSDSFAENLVAIEDHCAQLSETIGDWADGIV